MYSLKKSLFGAAAMALMLAACQTPDQPAALGENTENPTPSAAEKELNRDSLKSEIDQYRLALEGRLGEAQVLKTDSLRAKIKQKWSAIHFYSEEGRLVRIKTYPHENIVKRTEEFYLKDQALVLAVIEDDGSGERGKKAEQIDKMYYFHDGVLVGEKNNSSEAEYSLRESDGEELLQEVQEYKDLFARYFGA